jgi:hypothetical protein
MLGPALLMAASRKTRPRTFALRSALASLAFALASLAALLAAGRARAADLCLPDRPPTPGCQLAPPGTPPRVSPEEEAAYRAKAAADYDAANGPAVYRARLAERAEEQRRAFLQAAEAARPADVRVRLPTFEAFSGFRLGLDLARKDYVQVGPEVGLAYRIDRTFAIELPVSLLRTSSELGEWGMVGAAPSLTVGVHAKNVILFLRGGPDVLVPTGASGAAPNALVGANAGVGFLFLLASVGDGGFAAIGYDGRLACRAGVGGPSSVLDAPRCGFDIILGVRLAY